MTLGNLPILARLCLIAAAICAGHQPAFANPGGLTVRRGAATASQSGANLTVRASNGAVLDWSSFNIAAGETTTFLQPSSHSVAWNNINQTSPSEILGSLNANGYVILVNPSGFYFGNQSVITAGGFLAAAAPIIRSPSAVGGFWQFDGLPPSASVINYGQINVGQGGAIYLVANAVENHGTITAPDGTIGLYAGKDVLISDRPDGRGISAGVKLPAGSVDNAGHLIADGGTISLHAAVVNQNGLIQANSVRDDNGTIELVGSQSVALGASSAISAAGDAGISSGGSVSIKSSGSFSDQAGSVINVSGGVSGGNGGQVDLCAASMNSIQSQILSLAAPGWSGGGLLIDPEFIVIGNSGSGTVGSGGSVGDQSGSGTLDLSVFTAFTGFSHIDLQATMDITLAQGTTWNLNSSTGISSAGSTLTLEAGRNIIFGSGASLVAGTGWSVEMVAGRDFSTALSPASSNPDQPPALGGITPGVGGIYINGGPPSSTGSYPRLSGSVETLDGSLDLRAGNEIVVGSGFIRTDGGGNLDLVTGTGNVDAGNNQSGNVFTAAGVEANPAGVGGIATEAGGDLAISAGNEVLSAVPGFTSVNKPGVTIGCYGTGDVNITAGNSILGIFQVCDGEGALTAPQIGTSTSPVNLSLATGGWTATAQSGASGALGDIYLNEVFNPNGSLNSAARTPFQFNYSPDASVTLTAGNSVELSGSSIMHTTSNPDLPAVYPPILDITAGAGGVTLGNSVVLYPSAQAGLNITTLGGGSLTSANGALYQLVMSDSDNPSYTTFITGHSATPLQMPDASQPVEMNINGNIEDVSMQIPKRAIINVGGDAVNFYFTGQNLLPTDDSQINVAGNIVNQTDVSAAALSATPNLSIFETGVTGDPNLNLAGALSYNTATHQLLFTGRMTQDQLDFLLNPTVLVYDVTGNPVTGPNGQPETRPVTFESASIINELYTESQQTPLFPTTDGGLICGGPGAFSVSADNMDLGITAGIRSVLAALNPNIALTYSTGPSLQINLRGDLDVSSSQIASFNGGSITINAGGTIDVGSQASFTSDDTPKGIYTAAGGSISVTASGDVDVSGSRIATYDGGDISVVSTHGDVDAGNGGSGFFDVGTEQFNPVTHQVTLQDEQFFGSGIIALTAANSQAVVGNITVSAAGSISANSSGILQLAFDHANSQNAFVSLQAGQNIEANESGVLGVNVDLHAGGEVTGLIIAHQNINISATGSVSVTALANGAVNVSSGGAVSGSIVGGGNVSVSGDAITAAVASSSGTTSTTGDASGAKIGSFQGVAAQSAQKTTDDADQTLAQSASTPLDMDDTKKGAKKPVVSRTRGRVTVILPANKS